MNKQELPPKKDQCCGLHLGCYEFVEMKEKTKELRNQICNIIEVDIRSLFEMYTGSLFDYLHWNKNNSGENVKLYNNFKRVIQDRKVKVLKLFDEKLQKIREGKEYE